jgi:hypothetical protein
MNATHAQLSPEPRLRAGPQLVFSIPSVDYLVNRRECGAHEGQMDELIGRLVANTGVDRAAAEKAVGIILQFLFKEGPAGRVQALINALPGADAAMKRSPEESGGLFGGGLMAAGSRMMAAGLSMGQVQAVTRETIAFAREKVGEDAVGEIVGAIPGLGQFI